MAKPTVVPGVVRSSPLLHLRHVGAAALIHPSIATRSASVTLCGDRGRVAYRYLSRVRAAPSSPPFPSTVPATPVWVAAGTANRQLAPVSYAHKLLEFILEFLIEIVVQVVVEFVLDAGATALGRILETRTGRIAADILVISAVGLVAGYTWGLHVANTNQRYQPRSIWVSLALAAVAGSIALYARRDPGWDRRLAAVPQLLRFSVTRLASVALLNLVLAVGIAVGFNA